MNWNKGAKTRGRGTSFKGALNYYLHDKDKALTSERVGFVEMLNLAGDDPKGAWREMMATAGAAADLKRRAGLSLAGQKNTRPVYAFSIQWHPDDRPGKAHMREAALDVLKTLNLHEHQVVIVQHLDEPHAHVHLCVNLCHPKTGATAKLSKDHYILERWADNYELRMGVIRSPERRAKFEALDQGLTPKPRPKTPKRFQEPETKAANENAAARERARAISDQQRDYAARLKATQDDAWKRRASEQRALWNDYRTARQALRARHQFQLDKITKHKRDRDALPLSIQGFRDWKESREWKKLMARLKAEKRRFEYRERTLLGFVGNAIRLIRPGMERTGQGLLPMLFSLLVSGNQRRELLQVKQGLARKALSEKQFGKRKIRATRVRLIRDAQMAALSNAFDIQKQALDQRHDQEIAAQKLEWGALSTERKRLWAQWEAEFGQKPRQRQSQGAGGGRSASPAPRRPRQSFAETASINKPAQAADTTVKRKFEDKAAPQPDPAKPWRQRRSAAERKADGSYKPRVRPPKPRI